MGEPLFQRAMEHAGFGMALLTPDGRLRAVNPALCRMLGRDAADLLARTWRDIVPDMPADEALLAELLDGRRDAYRGRQRFLRPDGTAVWAERSVTLAPADEAGDRFVIVQLVDVSDPSGVEEHFRLLAENASDVVYVAGPDRRVTWISPNVREALGWDADELVGTAVYDLIHPQDRSSIDAVREAAYAGSPAPDPEDGHLMRIRRKDGSYVWMSLKSTQVTDPSGAGTMLVNGMRNVEALVAARGQAEDDEARLEATLRSLLDPHVLLVAVRDGDGRIVDFTYQDANDAACAYMGMPRERLEGARVLDLLPGLASAGLLAMYVHAVESGEPILLNDHIYPNELLGSERRYDIRGVKVGDALSFTWRDVTERYDAALRLARSEEQFRLIAENSSDVVLQASGGIMRWLSPSLSASLGWHPDEWVGHPFEEFTHPDDVALAQRRRAEIIAGAHAVTTLRLRDRDGAYHWVEVHAGPYVDPDSGSTGVVASFRVVDAEVEAREQLDRSARFDALTGLANRPEALQRIEGISRDTRSPGQLSAALFCDIDRFKDVNDAHGHEAGDTVLREIARRIDATVRQEDFAARFGGDELVVILTGIHGLDEAVEVGEAIRRAAEAPIRLAAGEVRTTVSIGVTLIRAGETPDALLSRADRATYQAKQQGRNQVVAIGAP